MLGAMVWILNVPKGLCAEDLLVSLWHYWEMVKPLRGGDFNGVTLKGILGPWLLSLLFLHPGHHEMSSFSLPHASAYDDLGCHRPQINIAI
jgi:hypothetical protein